MSVLKKMLSKFGIVTTIGDTYYLPVFIPGTSNKRILPSLFAKSQSIYNSLTNSITAFAGGGQADATTLTTKWNRILTCVTRDDSVKLPQGTEGMHLMLINRGDQLCKVYPASGENFYGQSDDVAISLPVNTYMEVVCYAAGEWEYRPVVGFYGTRIGNTAYAGGGQANATQLRNEYERIDTVATAADSVKLRAATKGLRHVVVNTAANAVDIYPQTGDNFLGLADNISVSLSGTQHAEFICFVDGTWTAL